MRIFFVTLLLLAFSQGLFAQDFNSLSRDERRELITSFVKEGDDMPSEYAWYDVDGDGRQELFLRNASLTVAYVHPKRSGWTELLRTVGNSQMEVANGLVVIDGMAGFNYHQKRWVALQDGIIMSDIAMVESLDEVSGEYTPQQMTYFGEAQEDFKALLEMVAEYPETTPVYNSFTWIPFPRQ